MTECVVLYELLKLEHWLWRTVFYYINC